MSERIKSFVSNLEKTYPDAVIHDLSDVKGYVGVLVSEIEKFRINIENDEIASVAYDLPGTDGGYAPFKNGEPRKAALMDKDASVAELLENIRSAFYGEKTPKKDKGMEMD